MVTQTKPTREEIALCKCFNLEPKIISDSELVDLLVCLIKHGGPCIDGINIVGRGSLKRQILSTLVEEYHWFVNHLEYDSCKKAKRNIENNIKRIFGDSYRNE